MAKDLIQDIKRPKRSLQDVLPTSPTGEPKTVTEKVVEPSANRERPSPVVSRPASPPAHRSRALLVTLIVLGLIAVLIYFGSVAFGRAIVTITPRQVSIAVTGTYRAFKLPLANIDNMSLGFQTMTIEASESANVEAVGEKLVSERASGTILITNRYSQATQKLIASTRFEAVSGKIYKIADAVVVPGYTLVGGVLKPGELSVKVTAAEPGADYNGELSTLTIPGFKNDNRFNTVTARATTPFAGGFIGARRVVAEVDRLATETRLTEQLKKRLLAEAAGQVPDDYVWYPESVFWRVVDSDTTHDSSTAETVRVTKQIELVAPIFSRIELSRELARRFLPTYDGAAVLLDDIERLNLAPSVPPADPDKFTEFSFTLAGEGILVWQFDAVALAEDLASRGTRDYQAVFVKYPSIRVAQASFTPPWLIRFPADPKRISLSIDTSLTVETPSAKIPDTVNQSGAPNGN
ncbi:MAG: hypothetical protein AAB415_01130 [Patescibacteria group bacterium]